MHRYSAQRPEAIVLRQREPIILRRRYLTPGQRHKVTARRRQQQRVQPEPLQKAMVRQQSQHCRAARRVIKLQPVHTSQLYVSPTGELTVRLKTRISRPRTLARPCLMPPCLKGLLTLLQHISRRNTQRQNFSNHNSNNPHMAVPTVEAPQLAVHLAAVSFRAKHLKDLLSKDQLLSPRHIARLFIKLRPMRLLFSTRQSLLHRVLKRLQLSAPGIQQDIHIQQQAPLSSYRIHITVTRPVIKHQVPIVTMHKACVMTNMVVGSDKTRIT